MLLGVTGVAVTVSISGNDALVFYIDEYKNDEMNRKAKEQSSKSGKRRVHQREQADKL